MKFLYKEVPFWLAKILKKKKVDYPGSMVYDKDGTLMWIGGFRRQINIKDDDNFISAPTWKWVINYFLK